MRLDSQWFELILSRGQLRNLPLSQFTKHQPPDVHLYMDASNSGLAVLNPADRQVIQVKFDEHEQKLIQAAAGPDGFNINVREQLCVALAVWCFGPAWKGKTPSGLTYVQVWSDNTSAISWSNRASSRNCMAQEINRAIGLAEAIYGIRLSCKHLPGAINTMADAGSRAWTPNHAKVWSNLSSMWSQIPVPTVIRKIYATFSLSFNPTHWPQAQDLSTKLHGEDGHYGVHNADTRHGYPKMFNSTHTNSSCTPSTTGTRDLPPAKLSLSAPCCPRSATLRGIISAIEQDTRWPCRGMQRLSPPPKQKQPITKEILKAMRQQLDFRNSRDRVLWGAAVVGFFFMVRRSEYLADSKKVKPYIIQAADVIFSKGCGSTTTTLQDAVAVTIKFRGSKTDQVGTSTSRTLHRSGSKWLCPVLAAWELKRHAMQEGTGLALCSVDSITVLPSSSLSDAIKSAAASVGADPIQFGTHSMRSGGATAMFSAGVDRLTIKRFGRWSSDTYERYTRINELASKSLATKMTIGALSRVSPAAPVGLRPAPISSRPR